MRVNLVKDPSLRSGTTTNYVALNSTLSIDTSEGFYGPQSLKVLKSGVNRSGLRLASPVPIVVGLPYAFSVYARIPQTIPAAEFATLTLTIQWLNSTGLVVSTNESAELVLDDDNTWYRVSGVWTAPAGATLATMQVTQPIAGSAGAIFFADAFMIEQAEYVRGFINNIPQAEKNDRVRKAMSHVPQVINGVRLGADITINDLVLNTVDEDNTLWVCTALDGWWGQSSPEAPDIPRGTDDGSYDVEARTQFRSVTITGFFVPEDPEKTLSKSIDRLVSAIDLTRKGGWLLINEGPTKAAWVRLMSKPTIQTVNARGRTAFSVTLRAADPIKYHWDDADPDGFTNVQFLAADQVVHANNIGTASVAGIFTITGPVGAGTRIYNSRTDETLTLNHLLRGAGIVARAQQVESRNNVATIYTTEDHKLRVGDRVSLTNMATPLADDGRFYTLTHVSTTFPYSISFDLPSDDINLMNTQGQIALADNDVLVVDTYNKAVSYNGETSGHRYRLATLTDWITIGPGDNTLEFFDSVTHTPVVSKSRTSNTVTLTTDGPHYLVAGEQVVVDLPTDAIIVGKSLTSGKVTLTTDNPHGFAEGDAIDVTTTSSAFISNKIRTSNVVTLTTSTPHGASSGDQIMVQLPENVGVATKVMTGSSATLGTTVAHGFSVGDSITVSLPTSANVTYKALTNGQATLTTGTAHGFAVGDTIVVTMPAAAVITNKARSGTQAVLTTASAHGFSPGDSIVVALPANATPVGMRSISATTRLATINTSAAHNFSVGDRVSISLGMASTHAVTQRSATTTSCTLTTPSGGQGPYTAGERIEVSIGNPRYDGKFTVSSVASGSVTYLSAGAAEAAVAASGSVTNLTTRDSYSGSKVIETIPSATSFTFYAWDETNTTSNSAFGSANAANMTNTALNGTKTISTVTANTFTYTL
jgi:hypothetical protein